MNAPSIRSFFPDLFSLLYPFRPRFLRAAGWTLLMQALSFFEPYVLMQIVDGIVSRRPLIVDYLSLVALGMLAVLLGNGFVQARKNRNIFFFVFDVERDLPLACGRKLLALPLAYHLKEGTGSSIGRILRGVGKTTEMAAVFLFEILPLTLQVIITTAFLASTNMRAMTVLLPCVCLFAYVTARVKMRLSVVRMERHELDSDADEQLGQAVENVMTVQAFAQEAREMRALGAIRDRVWGLADGEFAVQERTDMLRNAIVSVGRVGVIYVCAYAALGSTLSMGQLVFLSTLSEKVFIQCYRIGTVIDRLMECIDPVRRMVEILQAKETVTDPKDPLPVANRASGTISFDAVSYAYPTDSTTPRPVLHDVTLTIAGGETVGIVGRSGGGKSSLVKLLLRFDDPSFGAVTLDGLDLRLFARGDLRRRIGYVPQEVELFDATIAENIAYGRPDVSREDVVRAAKLAHADDFIAGLEHGYDTVVGNRGLRLSGGQRQRVGIARAVLLDPPILVLDEATSNVDVESERKIHEALGRLRTGRTVILIAHRLSTVQDADRIIVLEEGRVRETGTHQELVDQGGIYRHLVALQTRAYASH